MSDRLDRIEAIMESVLLHAEMQRTQIDALVESQRLFQASQQRHDIRLIQIEQIVESLAKSVQAHCDDSNRHQ